MAWNHMNVYEALLKKGHYPKPGEFDIYVSLDHNGRRTLNSILYSSDSRYSSAPVHIKKISSTFSEDFFKKISPSIEKVSDGSHDWWRYRVIDWGKLAKGIGL